MSKDVDWSPFYGEGEIVCRCDKCHREERFDFDDNHPDYAAAQRKLYGMGWLSFKSKDRWFDFCSEECRDRFIKEKL